MYTMVIAEFGSRAAAEAARRDIAQDIHPSNQLSVIEDSGAPQDKITFGGTASREALWKGALIGALLGLVVGLVLAGPLNVYTEFALELVAMTVFGGALFGGLAGVLIGANAGGRALREEEDALPEQDFLLVIEVSHGDPAYIERTARQHGALHTRTEQRQRPLRERFLEKAS